MKTCARCQRSLPIEAFHRPPGGKVHGYCTECRRAYNREWYRRRRERHIEMVRQNTRRYIERNQRHVDALKREPCLDCGVTFPPPVMEYDHVRGEKRESVSALVRRGASIELIDEEIAKCELVCANCHRVRTALRAWPNRLV